MQKAKEKLNFCRWWYTKKNYTLKFNINFIFIQCISPRKIHWFSMWQVAQLLLASVFTSLKWTDEPVDLHSPIMLTSRWFLRLSKYRMRNGRPTEIPVPTSKVPGLTSPVCVLPLTYIFDCHYRYIKCVSDSMGRKTIQEQSHTF